VSDVHPPLPFVRAAVARAIEEDIAPLGDMTALLLPLDQQAAAVIASRDEGIVAGRMCAVEAFAQVDPTVVVEWFVDDGGEVGPGDAIARVEGPLPAILTAERTALNFLRHLSGVASLTRRYVRAAHGKATVLDTRKTTPGLRALEKAAVRAGGGANHRGSLSDGVLVKDNHLGGLTITEAVRRAKARWPGRLVEVECDDVTQVREAVRAGASMVLLDNMTPARVRSAVKEIAGAAAVEVSGTVTLETIGDYARINGVDYVSVGALTHSAPALDIGLDLDDR
jgi:nicotinate-nucleotide pyrophosphorylase (carboxylating)